MNIYMFSHIKVYGSLLEQFNLSMLNTKWKEKKNYPVKFITYCMALYLLKNRIKFKKNAKQKI